MTKTINNINNGNIVIYVPDNAGAGKLRSVIFVPGIGEQNSNVDGLYYNGPLAFIKSGWAPDFIVVGIQPYSTWPATSWTDSMIKYLLANFPLDPTMVTLTGLSAGAKCVHEYLSSGLFKPSSIVTFSIDLYSTPEATWRDTPAWGLCGDKDNLGFFPPMSAAWKGMSGWPNKPWTTMVGYAHSGWNDFYNPNWKDVNGLSLYDWMKLFKTNNINVMNYNAIGAQIEAEAFSAQLGTAVEPSVEGVQDVGYIDPNDWLEYPIDVPADGNYQFDFRVASPWTNAKFQVIAGGVSIGTVPVPQTGGWQTWKTATITLPLKKGQQVVRLLSLADGWNLNWLKVSNTTVPTPKTLLMTITTKVYTDGSIETIKS